MSRDEEFAEYAAARWLTLVRAGISLGCGLAEAEDLAQTTLERCYVVWGQVQRAEHRDAYVSTMLLNVHRAGRRRGWRLRERAVAELPDAGVPDGTDALGVADALRTAVAGLSQGQREVIALRYYLRLTEPQIADVLGIAAGTVKSRLSRALAALAADTTLTDLKERS